MALQVQVQKQAQEREKALEMETALDYQENNPRAQESPLGHQRSKEILQHLKHLYLEHQEHQDLKEIMHHQ